MLALESRGVDATALLATVGLSRETLADPTRRHGLAVTRKLWELAVQATNDPAFGLEVARHTTYLTFHALGISLGTSATLLEALERIVRFFAIVTDGADLALDVEPKTVRLSIHLRDAEGTAPEAVDAFMAATVRLCRTLRGRTFDPLAVEMRRAEPDDPAPYARYFRVPVRFGAPLDAFTFDRAPCEVRLLTANAELARTGDAVAADHLARLQQDRLGPRVRRSIAEELPQGEPSPEVIARRLGLSLRTLQRTLQEEGTSFLDLLDETREELARSYLDEDRYSVSDITYLLGFSGVSNFSRAFKRWTGKSPRAYRAERA
ncbi:MAG TPA: AraC family transcriptional regulator [Polyangiaceae bacterium]|nr:AraC family transcriptional regulator [Polyangiaceae bacterium]